MMKHALLRILAIGTVIAVLSLTTVAAQSTPTAPNIPSVTLPGHSSTVTALAWSPDGSLLASSAGYFDSDDKVVRLWQADGHLLAELSEHSQPVESLAWSPDGSILATGSQDQNIKLWQKDGTLLQTIQAQSGIVFALAWSPDGKTLGSGSIADFDKNTVQLWDLNGKLLNTMTTQFSGGKFYNLGWSPDGQYLVGGATDYSQWKADGTLVFSHESCAHCSPSWGFAWSPDSQRWAVGNESGLMWVYSIDGQQIAQLQVESDVNPIRWSSDGKWLAGGKNLWQVNGDKFVLKNYVKGLNGGLTWSPDSQFIASSGDKVVYIQIADGKLIATLKGHTDQVGVLAWSPKGNLIASGSDDHTIRLWDVSSLNN